VADGSGGSGSAADRDGAKRRRAALRLLGELLAGGVCSGSGPLLSILKDLALPDYRNDRDAALTNLTLLGTFARTARELLLGQPSAAVLAALAAVPKQLMEQAVSGGMPEGVSAALEQLRAEQQQLQEELDRRFVLPDAEAAVLTKVLDRALEAAMAALTEDHRQLRDLEAENSALVNTRGDLPADAAAEYERRRKVYEALHRAVVALADGLGREMPELAEDAFTRLGVDDISGTAAKDASTSGAPSGAGDSAFEPVFEDPDARSFYESLPDLRVLVPSVLLFGDPKDPRGRHEEDHHQQVSDDKHKSKDGSGGGGSVAGAEAAATVSSAQDGGVDGSDDVAADVDGAPSPVVEDSATAAATETEAMAAAALAAGEDDDAGGGSATGGGGGDTGGAMELILSRLPSCVSRDLADELAVNFCYCNNKANRRRLVRALVDVPRSSLQLVPFFARIVAVLAQVLPDIPQGVIAQVESSYSQLLKRKDPTMTAASLEPRLRTARYMAELAKFRLLPPGSFFSALKQLLDDFTGHNIDTACALVEGAGRFMYRCPETRTRMENMLEVMMRLKNARNLDPRHAGLVDSAYFAVKPPSKERQRRRKRSALHEYIRHLIFEVLSEATIPVVLRKLLKLPWAQYEKYVVKCLLKVVRGRFSNIPLVSCLAAGLTQYHDSCGVALVDCVLDDIRCGLENPGAGRYQKRMADVRLLGELYNYMLCNSTPVFETLYLLVTFGHEVPELVDRLDPPDDFFRVRLVCALLDACGQYFGEGAACARLDRFLTFFQAYILSKGALPLDVEFDLQDILHALRPTLKRYGTYEEALAAVQDIIAREVAQFGAPLGTIGEEEDEEEERRGGASGRDGGGAGSETDDKEALQGEARSLDEISGRSSSDERDELDEDFEREWQALVGETQSRLGGIPLAPTRTPVAASSSGGGAETDSGVGAGSGSVTLRMLVRRGGKDDRSKELQVPLSSSMALAVRQREEEEAREREEMKRLVLAANRQQEEQAASLEQLQPGIKSGGRRSGHRHAKHTGQLDMSVLDDFGPSCDVPYERSAGVGPTTQQTGGGYGGRGGARGGQGQARSVGHGRGRG
ncbi:hypothetical protein Vretimale_16172, partial [Volvox reticuliferus]